MQRRAAIWILGAFKTSSSYGIKAIMGLIPIKLHLQKLAGRSQLQVSKLLPNYLLMNSQLSHPSSNLSPVTLNSLTNQQCSLVKGHLVDMANRSHECFPSFSPLNLKFSPGLRIIDKFSDHISFNICDREKDTKSYAQVLDNMVLESSLSPSIAIVASDTSVKNNVTTSIAHIHTFEKPLIKTIYYTVYITSTEVELFAIRCSINQSSSLNNISKIIVVTDTFHAIKKIFDLLVYPYQLQSTAILSDLHWFFTNHENNSIEFWECSSYLKWCLHNEVDRKTKTFNLLPLLPCKNSWKFSRKSECNNIVNIWRITFQASDCQDCRKVDFVHFYFLSFIFLFLFSFILYFYF